MESDWIKEHREKLLQSTLARAGISEDQRRTLIELDKRYALAGHTLKSRAHKAQLAYEFGRFLGKPFEQATRQDIERFLVDIQGRLQPSSFMGMKVFLKAFYRELVDPDGDTHPPIVKWIRLGNVFSVTKLPRDLVTPEEVRRMTSVADHPRDKAIIAVLYESAARISELLSLRVADVEFDAYKARITLRGKTGMRRVLLLDSVPDLRTWLNHHPFRSDARVPLFISWKNHKVPKPLLEEGVRSVMVKAAARARVDRHVHPHGFRHARLTELAKVLSPYELRAFAGWKASSKMADVYVHLSGGDFEAKLLQHAGMIPTEETQQASPLRPRTCVRCATVNSAAADYCAKCSTPLDETRRIRLFQEEERLRQNLPALLKLIEDPQVALLLAKKANAPKDAKTTSPSITPNLG